MSAMESRAFLLAGALAVAGCQLPGVRTADGGATRAAAAPAAATSTLVTPPAAPAPAAPRLTTAEIDARLSLLLRLRRFHEAGEFYDLNADVLKGKPEFDQLLRQIVDGLNKQYEAPLQEAIASLGRYQGRRPAPDQIGRAQEALRAAQDALTEYQSIQVIAALNARLSQDKRLQQAIERAQANINAAEAALNTPDAKLQRLVAERRLEEATALFRSESKALTSAKGAGPGLSAFARMQASGVDAQLNEATSTLRANAKGSADPKTWDVAAQALEKARRTIQEVRETAPFEIPHLRPAKLRGLEAALAAAERNWAAKSGEAFIAYAHTGGVAFLDAYPVRVGPEQYANRWPPQAVSRLVSRPVAELRAMESALGGEAPAKSRELLSAALAKAEIRAAAKAPPATLAVSLPPAGKAETAAETPSAATGSPPGGGQATTGAKTLATTAYSPPAPVAAKAGATALPLPLAKASNPPAQPRAGAMTPTVLFVDSDR